MREKTGILHHVELNVSDLRNTTLFWGWFLEGLGYSKFQEWDKGISWKLEDTYIVFVQTEERYLDVSYHRSRAGDDCYAVYFEDPDRIKVELVSPKRSGYSF